MNLPSDRALKRGTSLEALNDQHKKKTKEKEICDCESQSPPKFTLFHAESPESPSKQLASPLLDTTLQSQGWLFNPLHRQGGLCSHGARLTLCRDSLILSLVLAELNHQQSYPYSKGKGQCQRPMQKGGQKSEGGFKQPKKAQSVCFMPRHRRGSWTRTAR